jgi:hypothetical protein
MKTTVLFLFLFTLNFSQDFDFTKSYELNSKEDYSLLQKDFLLGLNYLENNPFDEDTEKRAFVGAFLLKWMTGSPTVSISLEAFVMTLTKENPQFLIIYLANMARYVIENPELDDTFAANMAGVMGVLNIYKKDEGVKSDDVLDDLVELEEDDELADWLKEKL